MKTRNRRTVAQRLFTADNIQLRRMTGTFVFRVFFYSLVIGLSPKRRCETVMPPDFFES